MTFPVGSLVAYLQLEGQAAFESGIVGAQRSLDLTGASATRMGAAVDKAGAMSASASTKVQVASLRATAAQERYNALVNEATPSTARLASAQATLISAEERLSLATAASNAALVDTTKVADSAVVASLRRMGTAAGGLAGGLRTMTQMLLPVQNDFVLAGLAVGAVGVLSLKAATDFQDATKRIQTQAGLSATQVAVLSKGMLNLSASVATTPTVLADAAYHIASVGLRGAQALDVLKTAAEGAKIGGADLTDVTNGLDAAVVSGIKGVQNYSQAMGNLNATVGAGDMSMQDLSDALGTGILAVAKTAGLALVDVDAALATFGDNNIRGSEAATKLRQVIMLMEAPSQAAAGALASIGITSTQLGDDMRKPNGLLVALTDLQSNLTASGKTATQQAAIISQAFGGSKTAGSVEVLLSQLSRLQSKYTDIDQGSKSFASDWTAYSKTFSFTAGEVKAGAEALGVSLGEKLLPAATSAMGWIGTSGVADLGKLGDAIGRIEGPQLSGYVSVVEEAGKVTADLVKDLEPLAKVVAGISFEALKVSGEATGEALHVVADALGALDTVVKDAKPEIEGLAVAFAAMKLTSVVGSLGNVSAALTVAKDRAAILGTSLKTSAAAGLSSLISPAGLAAAGIGAVAFGFIESRQESERATAAAKAWADAMTKAGSPQSYSTLTAYTAAVAADTATRQQNISALQSGITFGNRWTFVNQIASGKIQALTKDQQNAAASSQAYIRSVNEAAGALGSTADATQTLANRYGIDLTGSVAQSIAALKNGVAAQGTAGSSAMQLATAEAAVGDSENAAKDAANSLSDALTQLNGGQIDAEKAQDDFNIALSHLKDNLDASTRSLAGNSAGASTNREALVGLIQQAETAAINQANLGTATDTVTGQYDKNYQALLDQAGGLGVSKTALVGLLTQMHLIPSEVDTKIEANAAPANAAVGSVKQNLASIPTFTRGLSGKMLAAGAAIGASLDQGLAAGIYDDAVLAIQAANSVAGRVTAGMRNTVRSQSPSKVTMQIGRDISAGLAIGITNGAAQVTAAAQAVAGLVALSIAPKATDPTTLASTYGTTFTAASTAQGAVNSSGYTQAAAKVTFLTGALLAMGAADGKALAAAKAHALALSNEAYAAEHSATASKATVAALQAEARAASQNATAVAAANAAKENAQKALISAAKTAATAAKNAYDTLSTAAANAAQAAESAAQSLVQSLQSQADSMKSTVTSFETSLAGGIGGQPSLQSIWQSLSTNIYGDPITPNVGMLQSNLNSILASTQQFSTDLTSLVGDGANQDLVTQLTGMGTTAGDALAEQLLQAGPTAITALQTTMASIDSVASSEADKLAASFYGPGADAMSQFIAGLESAVPGLSVALGPITTEIAGLFGGVAAAASAGIAPDRTLPPRFAAGVTNFGGGVAMVGELGPELITLPRGSSVTPHGQLPAGFLDMSAVVDELHALRAEVQGLRGDTRALPSGIGDATLSGYRAAGKAQAMMAGRNAKAGRWSS